MVWQPWQQQQQQQQDAAQSSSHHAALRMKAAKFKKNGAHLPWRPRDDPGWWLCLCTRSKIEPSSNMAVDPAFVKEKVAQARESMDGLCCNYGSLANHRVATCKLGRGDLVLSIDA